MLHPDIPGNAPDRYNDIEVSIGESDPIGDMLILLHLQGHFSEPQARFLSIVALHSSK